MSTINDLSIYYQNVRGLRTKSHEFLSGILNCNYDIVCITETWLNDGFYNNEFFDGRYQVFRCDRDSDTSGFERGGEYWWRCAASCVPSRARSGARRRPQRKSA